MYTIDKNTLNKVNNFSLYNMLTKRVNINGEGWQPVEIDPQFFNDSINQIVSLIGGRKETKEKIKHILSNNIVTGWFTERITFCKHTNKFDYIAGQNYPAELQSIRKTLLTKYN